MTPAFDLSPWLNGRLPWWLWLLAPLVGILLALGSLSYAPAGRINLFWLWWLWAGLPLLGALLSLIFMALGRGRPWLFRWRERSLRWYPSRVERLSMFLALQVWWLLLGAGMLLAFLVLLLLTDLAFGWSSTLIQAPDQVYRLTSSLSGPWAWFWPAAVPDAALVEATRFVRIAPDLGERRLAGDWWPFLLASLLMYNLLPRVLLIAVAWTWLRWLTRAGLAVSAPGAQPDAPPAGETRRDSRAHWQSVPRLAWELSRQQSPEAGLYLGLEDWQKDEQQLRQFLATAPRRLVWQVNAGRSPLAELADLLALAARSGVERQALELADKDRADPVRHLASWRTFANRQQLVWLEDADGS